MTLWRPDNAGYCYSKEHAGLYKEIQEGYHDDDNVLPISEELANQMFEDVLYENKYPRKMISNNLTNRRKLKLRYKNNFLTRKEEVLQS